LVSGVKQFLEPASPLVTIPLRVKEHDEGLEEAVSVVGDHLGRCRRVLSQLDHAIVPQEHRVGFAVSELHPIGSAKGPIEAKPSERKGAQIVRIEERMQG
jgi:hypothetical protein